MPLSTSYTGCRICLWYDFSPNNWHGFGMNGAAFVYNTSITVQHSFQVNGTQEAGINSAQWFNVTDL